MKLFTSWRFSLLSTFIRERTDQIYLVTKVSYSFYIVFWKRYFTRKIALLDVLKDRQKWRAKSSVLRSRYISVLYHILSQRNIMPWDIFLLFLLWSYKNSYRARCCVIWLLNNYNKWDYLFFIHSLKIDVLLFMLIILPLRSSALKNCSVADCRWLF